MKSTVLLVLLSAMAAVAQDASVEGIVVHAATGEPMAGVHVRLAAGTTYDFTAVFGATSGPDGRFSIASMPAGTYQVIAERPGFVYLFPKEGTPGDGGLSLKAGDRVTGFKITMARRAVITGRVLDQYGDPVMGVSVQARPTSPAEMRAPAGGVGLSAATDDRGEYRISGAPGQYHILASARFNMPRALEKRTDGTSDVAYVDTYYPSTTGAAEAVGVEARPGEDANGIDITLASQREMITVSGSVSGIPDGPGAAVVTILSGNPPGYGMNSTAAVRAGGKFTFPGRRAGPVQLFARYEGGDVRLYSQTIDLTLTNSDVTDVHLALAPGGEITGNLELVGGPAGYAAGQKHSVALRPNGPGWMSAGRALSGETGVEGAFRIQDVPPGQFRVVVEPMPENGYLKALSLDGARVDGRVLDFSRGMQHAKVKVTVSLNGGQVSGTVLEPGGEPAAGNAIAFLVSDPAAIGPENRARVGSDGTYQFKGLQPGKYRLFAAGMSRRRGAWTPEMIRKLAEAAEEIVVKEGDRIRKNVTASAREASDAK